LKNAEICGRFIFWLDYSRYISGVARSGKLLIDHSSRGKSYRNLYVHSAACFANWHPRSSIVDVCVCVSFPFTSFASCTVPIDIRERQKCSASREGKSLLRSISHEHILCLFSYLYLIQFTFFDFIQRLTWIWRCQIIISFLGCINAYIA